MSDNQRIAAYLQEHGSITSYEIRTMELSGNPAQRITELIDQGYEIQIDHFHRIVRGKKRPCCRYTLIASPEAERPGAVRSAPESAAAESSGHLQPPEEADAAGGQLQDAPPVAPLQLFPESTGGRGHYESEAA
jgi:hypothetical protein